MVLECNESYVLHVASTKLTTTVLRPSMNIYAEIKLDGSATQHTNVIAGATTLLWNHDFTVFGTTSSTLSLSVKDATELHEDCCIGHVSTNLSTLLDACSENESTSLEIKSEAVGFEDVTTGIITVKLHRLGDRDESKVVEPESQVIHPPDCLDHLDGCAHVENQLNTVELMGERNLSQSAVLSNIAGGGSQQHDLNDLALVAVRSFERFQRLGDLADLENSISDQQRIVELTQDGHVSKPKYLTTLGVMQRTRFERLGKLDDLGNAITSLQKAVELIDDGHRSIPSRLADLGNARQIRFERLGELADLENAISNQQRVVELTDDEHPSKPAHLTTLGIRQWTCFGRVGRLDDLENAITSLQKAVELTDDGHPSVSSRLTNLGNSQETRFKCLGELADLENAISNKQKAVELMDDEHQSKPACLTNLGLSQQTRFERFGKLGDLENAISSHQAAVKLTDDTNPFKPSYLLNLGVSQETRFQRFGEPADLGHAIFNQQKANELMDDGHPSKPVCLTNLGVSQWTRFEHFGELGDLEKAIFNQQKAVALTGDGHPSKPGRLINLGISQRARFERHGELADLEKAIFNQQQAVELMDDRHPSKPACLTNLGTSQNTRFGKIGRLDDLENAIFNLQRAVQLMANGHPDKPGYLMNLALGQHTRFEHLGKLADLENAISSQQKAVEITDDRHPSKPVFLTNLGVSQEARFKHLGELADLDNAISSQQKAVKLTHTEHISKPTRLTNLGLSQQTRFTRLGELEDLENAIYNQQMAVNLTDDTNPLKPICLSNLGVSQETRFRHFGELVDIENAISNQQMAVKFMDDEHPSKPACLTDLGISQQTRFERLRALADIENAISHHQRAVELTNDRHPAKAGRLTNLGCSQQIRFAHLGKFVDIDNAISNHEKAVSLSDVRDPNRSKWLLNLGIDLESRYHSLGKEADLLAAVSAFQEAAHLKTAYPSTAMAAARTWAEISHREGDLLSALDGYRTALEILPKVIWLGLNAHSHFHQLIQEQPENLGCMAATCAIQLGRLEEAVELLDLGRSVYWQQVSSLRSDLEVLKNENKELANELVTVGRRLEAGIFSDSIAIGTGYSEGTNNQDSEYIGRERHRLVNKWESLVERVRQIPQFRHFLRPTSFCQLRQACPTGQGQVVIINVSQHGVDALTFAATGPIKHISLPDIDLEKLVKLSSNIVLGKPMNASATQREKYVTRLLKPTLRAIWDNIIVDIFNKIHIPLADPAVPPVHRIWWYLTGPLTFVPIHAAGPGGRAIDVSQVVISSYVTTLASLLSSQKTHRGVLKGHPKFLSISQSETPGETLLPKTIEEINEVAGVLHSSGWSEGDIVSLQGSEATVDHVSCALDSCSWVHFACHGSQDTIVGMRSAFSLHDGDLELKKIASKRLSAGRFAFLSACHAASGLKDLPGEAFHLAAGIQFAGFPSVIATMWQICDGDAPKVAGHTYRYLFRNGLQSLDPSEAATALNRAILHLRKDPKVTVDQWAPFIHFGI